MFENLYTTKMSANKKALESRFSKILSHSDKVHKAVYPAVTAAVIFTVLCANIVMAMVGNVGAGQFLIEVRDGDTVLALNNTPFVYDNTVYLPLRELFEKCGFLESENSYLKWDNGKIHMNITEKIDYPKSGAKYFGYYYGIEIGKAEYTLNPGSEEKYRQKWNISNSKQMQYAPILKDGITYIPFEFVEYLVNRVMMEKKIFCSVRDLSYNSQKHRKADYINDNLCIDYVSYYENFPHLISDSTFISEANIKSTIPVVNAFYDAFAVKDYETMKKYCTAKCIQNHFSGIDSPHTANIFGMNSAVMKNISIPITKNDIKQEYLCVTINGETPPHFSFVGGQDVVVKVFFQKQSNGTYLIDDFAY